MIRKAKNMASERTEELYRVLLSKGYPKELCAEIAYKNMNTDYIATRMQIGRAHV